MFWFFVTPIVYTLDRIPEQYRGMVLANPATPLVLPYQEILYGGRVPDPAHFAIAAGWAVFLVAVAVYVFASMRNSFVESL
jgi:ABC-2 type transport system permease protein